MQVSVVANFLKEVYSAISRKDKTFNFGWKKNSLNFNAGILFKLSDSIQTNKFSKIIPIAVRNFDFKPIPY